MSSQAASGAVTPRLGAGYALLWTGQLGSILGTMVQYVALPLWVLSLTGSPVSAGLAFAIETLPVIALAPWAGVIADRFPRRGLVLVCELISVAAVLAMTAAAGVKSIAAVLAGAAVVKSLNAISVPAIVGMIRELVAEGALRRGVSYFEGLTGATVVLGPPLGALLFDRLGVQAALLVNAGSFLIGALCMILIKPAGIVTQRGTDPGTPHPRLLTGFHMLVRSTGLRALLAGESAYFLCFGGSTVIALVAATRELGEARAGWYLGSLGISMAVCSWLVIPRWTRQPGDAMRVGAVFLLPAAIALAILPAAPVVLVLVAGCIGGTANAMIALGASLGWQRQVDVHSVGQATALRRSTTNATLALSSVGMPLATQWSSTAIVLIGGAAVATIVLAVLPLTRTEPAQPQ